MKNVSSGFLSMVQGNEYLMRCDLYTITLQSGAVWHYTNAPVNITFGGNTYQAANTDNGIPGFTRGAVKLSLGLQVETLDVTLLCDQSTTVWNSTQSIPAFAAAGGFDNATIKIDTLLTTSAWDTTNGVVNLFTGVVSDVSVKTGQVKLSVASNLIYLNAAFPRNYFLPDDNNALFSPASGLSASAWAVNGSVTAATSTSVSDSAFTQAAGWFALGYVVFTSGACNGLTRTVKASDASGNLTLLYPLPSVPAVGDTFTAYPGYDKTQATCQSKFNNLAHFRGFPYVPTPEVLELGGAGSPPNDTSGGGAGLGGGGGGGIGRGSGGQFGRFAQR